MIKYKSECSKLMCSFYREFRYVLVGITGTSELNRGGEGGELALKKNTGLNVSGV